MMTGRRTWVGITLWGLMLCSGCATLDMPWFDRMPEASKRNPVVQIVCMWEPSEGRDPKGVPCRGFAGQILFLGNKGGVPVAVDGAVSVYVFDDIGTEEEQATPIHQFNFDAKAWNRHLQNGSLGPAYNCFIPYTRSGNMEAICTVRIKYMPENAQEILSDPSHITMRGKKRNGETTPEYDSPLVSMLSRPQAPRGPRTTTIPLQERNTQVRDQVLASGAGQPVDPLRQVLDDYKAEQAAQQAKIEPVASQRMRLGSRNVQQVNYEADTESHVTPANFTTEEGSPEMIVE